MGASNEKGDAKGSVEEGGKMVRARWSGVTKWEGVGWITGRNESISKCAWQIAGLALGLLHIPYESKAKRWKKTSLLPLVTSFRDKTLFKPTASPSTGSGGPCNEHRQKAKSCVLHYEILMFHCFTLTISRINTSNALWFSDTRDKNGGNDEGVKCRWTMLNHVEPCWTTLNHVEPCWTLPLRNATFYCLERPCSNTAPASATSDSGAASNSTTCRKQSSRDSKVLHAESQCFNICFTCTRWHVKVSGSFMFSWNYWLMMGMSYEQNTMGKGPNLSPWGLVNKRPRKKMWERRRHRKPWALAMRREMRRVAWRKVARWSERGGVEWLSGKELGGSLEEMNPYQSVHDKLRVWHLDCSTSLSKARQKDEKKQARYH